MHSGLFFTYYPNFRSRCCRYDQDEFPEVYFAYVHRLCTLDIQFCISRIFYWQPTIFKALVKIYCYRFYPCCYRTSYFQNNKKYNKTEERKGRGNIEFVPFLQFALYEVISLKAWQLFGTVGVVPSLSWVEQRASSLLHLR